MSSYLIGVSGKAQHGKDTFANHLVEAYGFTRLAFADAMRDAAYALDPLIQVIEYPEPGFGEVHLAALVKRIGWDRAKTEYREVRRTLQRLGTEVGRELFGVDFWVDRTLAQAALIDGPVVITDVRFPNEADAIKRIGTLVRVYRPGVPPVAAHASETALDDYSFPFLVRNDGTIDDLHTIASYYGEHADVPVLT